MCKINIFIQQECIKIDSKDIEKQLSEKSAYLISEGSCDTDDWSNDAESALTLQE